MLSEKELLYYLTSCSGVFSQNWCALFTIFQNAMFHLCGILATMNTLSIQ
ncbi:Protein of unknown function [Gryllus bimaculatus]|nr:Protein of unknown function [Gryllus bimaculatus]